ncbi:MAG TPA: recombinase family protein [Planctomycetaceae bacterium]|jgi:DNA invertase Pin-like site-specific DNA recombinase|nr:recombinase family protein [Planctomycetaceae bacterium]
MKIIAYYRVSTKQQGKSGLGLEGQQSALQQFAQSNKATIVATYQEIESGKRSDRPELAKAISHAKRSKAVLVVAKLDRLSRNVAFLSRLMESGVEFTAVDNPHANRFSVHILSCVAEFEAQQISDRTKMALQAAKVRGVKLGSARPGHWDGREQQRLAGTRKASAVAAQVHRQSADDAYGDLYATMKELRASGQTFRQIASQLNQQGHSTRNGKEWNASQVLRVLRRAG